MYAAGPAIYDMFDIILEIIGFILEIMLGIILACLTIGMVHLLIKL